MKWTHFFWDFDGTLFDTYGRITRAFVKGLADTGVRTDFDTALPLVKRSLGYAADWYAARSGAAADAVLAAYHVHSEEESDDTMRLFPGAREVLEAVLRGGGRNYLYTHRGTGALDALARNGLTGLFSGSVTGADGYPLKPAPDALLAMMTRYGLQAADCVMVGDRDIDLDAGKNAGMAGILFDPDGFYPDYPTPWRYASMTDMRKAIEDKEGEKQ